MKSNNPKKILFTVGSNAAALGKSEQLAEDIANGSLQQGPDGNTVRLIDGLMLRVQTLYVNEKVTDYQYYYFRERVKKAPAVTDIKLDGDVLVLIIADGTEERVQPGDGAELPQVDIIEHVPFYQKAWYWLKTHKAVAIGGGTVLFALVVLLIVKLAKR